MSDFGELFTPASDPKHLTPAAFVAKEWGNAQAAVNRLPAELQPVATTVLNDTKQIVTTGLALAGDAVAAYISGNSDNLRVEIANLIAGASGISPGGKQQLTAAGQDAITSAAAMLQAVLAHEIAQFQAASAPQAPPVPAAGTTQTALGSTPGSNAG